MTIYERQNWITNIENSANVIASYLGTVVVASILERYGARHIEDIDPSFLPDVFNEMYAIEADLK